MDHSLLAQHITAILRKDEENIDLNILLTDEELEKIILNFPDANNM